MKTEDYRTILNSIEQTLRLIGDEPPEKEADLEIYNELRKIRETLIRAQRDSLDKNLKRPDSRSPTGVQ
ncbi:MAG TPA: hypothetical protein VG838_09540 [Opitutaceae bacterium]|nr:hypothetical protein [Opitutaceae bacterium]